MWEASEGDVNSCSSIRSFNRARNWKIAKQKDSENKRRLTKIARELFHEYLKEKRVQKPEDKKDTNVEIVCRYFVYL